MENGGGWPGIDQDTGCHVIARTGNFANPAYCEIPAPLQDATAINSSFNPFIPDGT